MTRILFRPAKVTIAGKKKVVDRERSYLVRDVSKPFNVADGMISAKELSKKNGSTVKTNTKAEYTIFDAEFIDLYKRLDRGAQIITPKDIGTIILGCGLGSDSFVVEGGTGSGALACYLGRICKKVVSYDVRDDAHAIGKKNAKMLDLKNVSFKVGDLSKITEKNADTVILDMPDPWNALASAKKSVKVGGFIVSYVPTVLQVVEFAKKVDLDSKLARGKTIENVQRHWKISGEIAKPGLDGIGHTGFITFVRRIS